MHITGKNVVLFSSPYGECIGVWSAGTPKCKDYTVELDLAKIEDNSVIQKSEEDSPSLLCKDGTIFLRGFLEDYEEDGYLTLRLDEDYLCVETEYSANIAELVGSYITLKADCLYLYDRQLL